MASREQELKKVKKLMVRQEEKYEKAKNKYVLRARIVRKMQALEDRYIQLMEG